MFFNLLSKIKLTLSIKLTSQNPQQGGDAVFSTDKRDQKDQLEFKGKGQRSRGKSKLKA